MAKLIRKFLKKIHPKKEEQTIIDTPVPEPVDDEDLVTDFMVKDQPKKKNNDDRELEISINLYQPGMGVDPDPIEISDRNNSDPEHLMGHEVQVVELPETKTEEIDPSWIDLEIKRDFKNIMKELETRNVNCYEILEVPRNAETSVIRKAYRTFASKYHPDRGTKIEGMTKDGIIEKIREINYSKEILLDPTMRALHDKMMREHEKTSTDSMVEPKREFDPSLLEFFPDSTEISQKEEQTVAFITDEDDSSNGLGVLYFKKWDEEHEHFTDDFIDYIIQLDDSGYVNYGEVLMGDLTDMDEIFKLKRVSNFSQAINNKLFEVWVLPPFYYMAVPIKNKEHLQDICDMLKESFDVESIFFDYPKM